MAEKLSLTELQLVIKDSLYLAFPSMYWVTAEIAEITENFAGHCYLELVEKNKDEKNIKAKVKAIIWNSRYSFIKSFFENTSGDTLRVGLKILIKIKVDYHEVYGLSLNICDIDPSYTIGEMAMKRQMIIKRLEDEGIFGMNKEADFPLVPRRIAVISSKNADGFTDFINHLKRNSYGYMFHTCLFDTVVQGSDTEQSVVRSLDRVAANIGLFDVVVIIRGGGSQTDLSWFDNYNIAYYITQFPLPVITGIGHDKDMSVTDMVAYESLRTPTAVADYLVNCVSQAEGELIKLTKDITDTSRVILERNRTRINACMTKLHPVARLMLSEIKESLSEKIIRIIDIGKKHIGRSGLMPANQKSRLVSAIRNFTSYRDLTVKKYRQDLISLSSGMLKVNNVRMNTLENALEMVRPENVLKRGYTITSLNGRIIKSSTEIKVDQMIDTQFSDGNVKSKVVD